MGYRALYREFRPLKFSDMVGQDHISQILKNQIMNDRVGHAYLFSGIRGTGKTTTAKIFARAINCLNPVEGEPCNECEICKGILNETLSDVTEIDAASNNGVDNIREIRDEVMYLPTKAKYRVYIIDEVHMLSTGAFNALLKTLEEPPKHVKFILATTEPNKLPATILSRCQRFDFKRISNENVVARLEEILRSIGKTADVNALKMIAEISEGAMRDAISILDRCVSDTDNITVDYISGLIGMPDGMEILDIVDNMVDKNASSVITKIDNMLNEGKNISLLLTECIKHTQNVLVYLVTNKVEVYSQDEQQKVQQISKKVSVDELVDMIAYISEVLNNIKWSSNQNILAKALLIKLCVNEDIKKNCKVDQTSTQTQNKEEKRVNMESTVQECIPQKQETVSEQNKDEVSSANPEPKAFEQINSAQQLDTDKQKSGQHSTNGKDIDCWNEILTELKDMGKVKIYANLINASAQIIAENVIGIYFKVEFAKTIVENKENIDNIKQCVKNVLGKDYEIRCFLEKEKGKSKLSDVENTAKQFNIPIDIVDE